MAKADDIELNNPNLLMVKNPKRVSEVTVDLKEQRAKLFHGAALSVNFSLALELLLKGVDVDCRHPVTGRTPLGTLLAHVARSQFQIPNEKSETQPWYRQMETAWNKMTNDNPYNCTSANQSDDKPSLNEYDSLRLCRLFLKMGANPNKGALHAVAESPADTGKFIAALLRAGADPLKTAGKHSDGRDAFACCSSQSSFQKMHGLAAGVNVSRWNIIQVAVIPFTQLSATLILAYCCGMRIGFTLSIILHLFFVMWMGEEEQAPLLVQTVAEPKGRYFLAFTIIALFHLGWFALIFLSPAQTSTVNQTYCFLFLAVLGSLALVVNSDAGLHPRRGVEAKSALKVDIEQWQHKPSESSKVPLTSKITSIEKNGYRICETCLIVKEQQVRHCSVCDRCIRGWDHHCFWVGNCIASRNRRYFVVMLMIFLAAGLCQLYMFVVYIAKYCDTLGTCPASGDGFESCRASHVGECAVYQHPTILLCHLLALLPVTWVTGLLGDQLHRVGLTSAQRRSSEKTGIMSWKLVFDYPIGILYFLISGDDT